jgi:hypothetical protein
MTFIPVATQLLQAVKANNAEKIEELILSSDSKNELITEYITINGEESLTNFLPQFRSKGLVINIQALLNI